MNNFSVLFLVIVFYPFVFLSQDKPLEREMIQLSGVAISEETLEPMPFTTVYDKTIKRGVVSDYYGYFTLIVYPGDSIVFANSHYDNSTFLDKRAQA